MTSSLAPGVQDRVAALLWKYQDVITLNDNDLGCTQLLGHRIDTSDALPVRQPARRLPFHQQGEVRGLIDDMLSRGIIEPCCGPWASPIVSVKKKDGSTRFVSISAGLMTLRAMMHNRFLGSTIRWMPWEEPVTFQL